MQGLLTKPFMQAKSLSIPKFDIRDPSLVLYLPLWRPDMVATCGDITNGTGTLSASPTILTVGANTVTVSSVGTFVVRMPEGGTVASGTTTVSGSPVTISAGVASTITTTGGAGNITCTVSNIIRSKDKNNRACTVDGATWGSRGRLFDGTDDYIDCGVISLSGDITVIVWTNPTTLTDYDGLASQYAGDAKGFLFDVLANGSLRFIENPGAGEVAAPLVASDVVTGQSQMFAGVVSGTNVISYIARTDTLRTSAGGAAGGITASSANLYLSRGYVPTAILDGIGIECAIYNRAFSQGELRNHHLRTKGGFV